MFVDAALLISSAIVGGVTGVTFAVEFIVLFVLMGIVLMLHCAAYDNLICPKCGKRIARSLNEPYSKENKELLRRIAKGLPITCINCGRLIEIA